MKRWLFTGKRWLIYLCFAVVILETVSFLTLKVSSIIYTSNLINAPNPSWYWLFFFAPAIVGWFIYFMSTLFEVLDNPSYDEITISNYFLEVKDDDRWVHLALFIVSVIVSYFYLQFYLQFFLNILF